MGVFDSVYFNCPSCGEHHSIEFQSKAGPCTLSSYPPEAVPVGIAADIKNDIERCRKCDAPFRPVVGTPDTVPVGLVRAYR